MGKISERMIELARGYVGMTEVKPNDAPWLQELTAAAYNPTGWKAPQSYCIHALCCLAEIACDENACKFPFAMSDNTQVFYDTAKKNGFTKQTPAVGDIVIFEIGNTGMGHAELVTGVRADGVTTIGFNTSPTGSGNQHNGTGCFEKLRLFKNFLKTDAPKLWIRGYVATSQL